MTNPGSRSLRLSGKISAPLTFSDSPSVILRVPACAAREMLIAIAERTPGTRLELAVITQGERRTVEVTLGERPAPELE